MQTTKEEILKELSTILEKYAKESANLDEECTCTVNLIFTIWALLGADSIQQLYDHCIPVIDVVCGITENFINSKKQITN